MIQLKNNAQSMLAYPVSASDTLLQIIPEDIARFPNLSVPGDHFYCAIADSQGNLEFVRVAGTNTQTATLTVVRGAEGTTPRGWNTGDRVQLRMSMATWTDMAGDWWQRVKTAAGDALAPTLISASSFSLSGDWMEDMQEGRKIRVTASDGTQFKGYVASAVFTADATTVTMGGDPAPQLAGTPVAVDMGLSTELESHLAKIWADSALSSKNAASQSETNAAASALAAESSETNAKVSETAAEASKTAAATSETNAKTSETNAFASAETAAASATAAQAAKAAAEAARDEAQDIANVGYAAESHAGLAKVDGKTTQADAGGTITAKDVAIDGELEDLASARGQVGPARELGNNVDFNTVTEAGLYLINATGSVNAPRENQAFFLQVVQSVKGAITKNLFQIAYNYSPVVDWVFIRQYRMMSSSWSAWTQLITSSQVGDGLTVNNGIISIPEYDGATASTAGTSGLVPPADAGQQESFLTGGGEYKHITSLGPVSEKSQDLGTISGSVTIDLSAGLSVSATIGGAVTLAFMGVPIGGAAVVVLRLTNGGSSVVTWPATIAWANSTAPRLTATGTDMIVLVTDDGGASWMGSASLKYGAGA